MAGQLKHHLAYIKKNGQLKTLLKYVGTTQIRHGHNDSIFCSLITNVQCVCRQQQHTPIRLLNAVH